MSKVKIVFLIENKNVKYAQLKNLRTILRNSDADFFLAQSIFFMYFTIVRNNFSFLN